MVNLLTPYNSLLPFYIYVSKRPSELCVVHIHNNLLELPRNTEVSVISDLLDTFSLYFSSHWFCVYFLLLMTYTVLKYILLKTPHM